MKFVLVHGAAHNGAHFDTVAALLRADGHEVWCPTTAGNRDGDDPSKTTLEDAIDPEGLTRKLVEAGRD